MAIRFEIYGDLPPFCSKYEAVRKFLIDVNQDKVVNSNFLWARWEWAMSLITSYGGSLEKNGLWFDGDKLVALATNEVSLGKASFVVKPGYEFLKEEMLDYSIKAFSKDGVTNILIADTDDELQKLALARGYIASQSSEITSAIDLNGDLSYKLTDGFTIRHLADGYDLKKLQRCTYRGFGNGEEVPETEPKPSENYHGPYFNKNLHTIVEAPEGTYAAYCGAWFDQATQYAYIEPVCTDPTYRKRGLGKAAVYESLHRCAAQGAKTAYVISGQQFYYNIGFYPVDIYTWWISK